MSLVYTSQDAYNGCLSLFSQEDAVHRGMVMRLNKIKITGGTVSKTATGYEFNISRITTSSNKVLPARSVRGGRLNDDSLDEDPSIIPASQPYSEGSMDYYVPETAYAKIILTTDDTLFPNRQIRYNVVLQISNFDFSDFISWPALSKSSVHMKQINGANDSCSVSLAESWSVCDASSDLGSETGGDWEFISMEAIGDDLQKMSMQDEVGVNVVPATATVLTGCNEEPIQSHYSAKRSYADMVKIDTPNMSAQEVGYSRTPFAVKQHKWQPKYQVKQVSIMDRVGVYGNSNTDNCEGSDDGYDFDATMGMYTGVKSFGADARSTMLIANVTYCRQKALGVISVGSRVKSVK